MDPQSKAEFISAYTRILMKVWSSDEFADRLMCHPCAVIREQGLEIAPGATVQIIWADDAEPDLETQISAWEEGIMSGRHVLYVPDIGTPAAQSRHSSPA